MNVVIYEQLFSNSIEYNASDNEEDKALSIFNVKLHILSSVDSFPLPKFTPVRGTKAS